MELALFIYLIETVLGGTFLPSYFAVVGSTLMLVIIVLALWVLVEDEMEDGERNFVADFILKNKGLILKLYIVFFVLKFFGGLLPSQETAYKMAAAYGISEVVVAAKQSEDVKRIAGKSLMMIETSIDKFIDSTDNSNNETDNKE